MLDKNMVPKIVLTYDQSGGPYLCIYLFAADTFVAFSRRIYWSIVCPQAFTARVV